MSMRELALTVAIDIVIVAAWTLAVGISAPRWPARWLARDIGPLALTRFDVPATYARLRVSRWAARLPEAGAVFGGQSKRTLPGRSPEELTAYLREVRRAEWVHWLSMVCIVPIAATSPWWLALMFAIVVVAINAVFIVILRFNRMRLLALVQRGERVVRA